jgi:hypothetical protein
VKGSEKKRVLDPDDPGDRGKILAKIANQLRTNGAVEEEMEFLVRDRVELNAFNSRGLVDWLERKLEAAGVRKVVPTPETLSAAASGFAQDAVIARLVASQRDAVAQEAEALIHGIDLEREVHRLIGAHPELSWDRAVRQLVNGGGAL